MPLTSDHLRNLLQGSQLDKEINELTELMVERIDQLCFEECQIDRAMDQGNRVQQAGLQGGGYYFCRRKKQSQDQPRTDEKNQENECIPRIWQDLE